MKRFIAILLIGLAAGQAMAATSSQVLDIYAQLAGRTVLRPFDLRKLPASLTMPDFADTNRAINFIEDQLKSNHLAIVRDGRKFVWILPADWRNSQMADQLDRLASLTADDSISSEYSYNFQGVDINEALNIYAAIRDRTILRPMYFSGPFNLKTVSPLTRSEAIHAFDVLLALNGVATFDDGDKFVQMLPLDLISQVQTNAPKMELGAPLIDPAQIQKSLMDTNAAARNQRPGMSDATPPTTAYRLVEYYAELNNQKAQPPEQTFPASILFKTVTPLSKPELLYAITTTLALNNLMVVPVDHDTITLGFRPLSAK